MPVSIRWLGLSLLVIAADQATKLLALGMLRPYDPVEVLPVFDLTLMFNTGAAFSFLSGAGGWQRWFFISLALVVSVVLAFWLARIDSSHRAECAGLALIIGGALGNVIDRIYLGHVVDFLHFHVLEHYWPAFNIADSAITIGVGLLLLDAFVLQPRRGVRERAARN